ncbi:uncharacterized protein Dwil_GK22787 [Drosophila willistoni]|uniref:COMM domain-containing protein n=1 Tax=Drosophila willistoni TaxID=7260 RepID=B4NG97_DROWI|nr:uncharacterized protein LOC6649708 [Drosophila willistoni]EDW83314.1 uncharacterized protein Dwil_GK22787 [Drosophila willistoni]
MLLSQKQRDHLSLLQRPANEVVELCKAAFEFLLTGPNPERFQLIANNYTSASTSSAASPSVEPAAVQHAVEALISLLIHMTTRASSSGLELQDLLRQTFPELGAEVLDVLEQFVTSKRSFIEGSIKSANIRSYRLVNLDWRLEVRIASRSLLEQCQIFVTMKLYLHTEPKNENRELLEFDLMERSEEEVKAMKEDERQHRKDLLVQTDVGSLVHMIKTLEDALNESKTRRIRNIVDALH